MYIFYPALCIFYVAYKVSVEKTGLYIGRVHLSGVGHSSVIRFESPKTGFYLSLSFFSVLIEHRQLVFVVLSGSAILPSVLAAVIHKALVAHC